MKIRKKIIGLLAVFLLLAPLLAAPAHAAGYKPSFDVHSDIAYLLNLDTGAVVYEKNADKKAYPASLTKIMTFIVAYENIPDLENTMITAPGYIYDELYLANASTADIRRGETISALDLLYAMMLPSSCEAASILADHVGSGSIPDFVAMMNAKAKSLGAVHTNFVNAHGLYDPKQVTTARDMALITKYALGIPLFEKIWDTAKYQMPTTPIHPNGDWYVLHTDRMLFPGNSNYYKEMTGGKTGTLDESGRNLVSAASKNGYNYLLVTMDAPIYDAQGKILEENLSYTDAKNLYNWAFQSFSIQTVLNQDELVTEAPVALADGQDYVRLMSKNNVTALLPAESDKSVLQRSIVVAKNITAPIWKGDVLGKLELKTSGETIATVDLIAMDDVDRSMWLYSLDVIRRFFGQSTTQLLVGALVVLVLLYLIAVCRYNLKKRRRAERRRAAARGPGGYRR